MKRSVMHSRNGHRRSRPETRAAAPARAEGECTIPSPIPHAALPDLVFKRDLVEEQAIREYMEVEGHERVTHAERVTTEHVLGRTVEGWDVRTIKGRWWVITNPTNLYSQKLFPSLDYTITFHVGLTARMMSRADTGVPELERALLAPAWRRWEQAAEALDQAEEAEDFQGVGMRCRECLVAMVHEASRPEMVPAGEATPKRSDVVAWCELIANHAAHGASAERVRGYMKSVSGSAWQLVNWLTHAQGATQADAIQALDITRHVIGTFGTAMFRHVRGIPDRCLSCGSYKIGLRTHPEDATLELVPGCQACGWIRVDGDNRDAVELLPS